MQYEEEIQAKHLETVLPVALATLPTQPQIAVQGAGVHWTCDVMLGVRSCTIDCFGSHGYAIAFKHQMDINAMGRTAIEPALLGAIHDWLQGAAIQDLYQHFDFVDHHKRWLEQFMAECKVTYPEFERTATIEIEQEYGDFYYLWFRSPDRACCLSFYGQNQIPTCTFYWDDSKLFAFLAEDCGVAMLVVKRWICDNAQPSALEQEFPWLETGKVAHAYEAGHGIEGEFVQSWDSIEKFYIRVGSSRFPVADILRLITHMREAGFDRTLRAGQSMYTFILSRARRHGLQRGQWSVAFDFDDPGMTLSVFFDEETKLTLPTIEYTPQIEGLLRELEKQAIT